jgi:hypothetical protein
MQPNTIYPVVIYCPWKRVEIAVGHSLTKAGWHNAAGCPYCGECHPYEAKRPRLDHGDNATSPFKRFRRPYRRVQGTA